MSTTPHTTVTRSDRARYDRETIDSILDEATHVHVGIVDQDRPVVIPLLHARIGDHVYLHGSPATRIFRRMKTGIVVCITATLLDGLVLAKSAFAHSANYRSVVLFGRTEPVADLADRREALDAYTDKVVPGRRASLRPMTEREVRGTAVIRVPIIEASAKIRTGPPIDEDADAELPIWTGTVPIETRLGAPIPSPGTTAELPHHISAWLE